MRQIKQWDARHPQAGLVLAYSAVFAALWAVWLGIFACNGRSLIWYADTAEQHYPALMYLGRWLRQAVRCLVTGQTVPTWDLSIGLGADIITTLSYYGLGDPLDLLSAFVPSARTHQLLAGLIVLRGWLGGAAFLAYSRYHRNSRFGSLLGAVAYAFCGWFLQTALTEPIFSIPLYCFPLVLLGADWLFDGRSPLLFIAAVALAAGSNFLFFYMIALLTVVYAAVKYLYRFRRYGLLRLPVLFCKFVVCALIGTAMSAATLLPTALALTSGTRFSVQRQTTSYPFRRLWDLLANLSTSAAFDGYSTYCGVTAAAVLAVLALFALPKRHRLLKAAWAACLVLMMLPAAGRVLNGFSYVQNRWVWAFAMLEAFVLARLWPELAALDASARTRLFWVLLGYLALAFWYREARTEWAFLAAALLLVLALWLSGPAASARPGLTRAVALGGCCLGVVLNLGYQFGADESRARWEYLHFGEAWNSAVAANPAVLLKQVEDDSLWRYDSGVNSGVNSAMLLEMNGVSYFFSLNNSAVSQWMLEMGYNEPTDYCYETLQHRSLLQSFLGAKYFLSTDAGDRVLPAGYEFAPVIAGDIGGLGYAVSEKRDALPIGFTADRAVSRADYEALTPVERQSLLLDAVVLEDADADALPAAAPRTPDVVTPAADVALNGVERLDERTYYAPQDGATIVFTIREPVDNAETYLVVQGMDYRPLDPDANRTEGEWAALDPTDALELRKKSAVFCQREDVYLHLVSDLGTGRINYALPTNQYYCGRRDFACHFGWHKQGMTTLTVVLPFAGTYTFDRLAVQCQKTDTTAARAAARRADGTLENVQLSANRITGTAAVRGSRLLVMQFPYSDGWSALVDGKDADLLRVDTAFMGLKLEEGEHIITLTYHTPGLAAGAGIAVGGWTAFLTLALLRFRRRRTARRGRAVCADPALQKKVCTNGTK